MESGLKSWEKHQIKSIITQLNSIDAKTSWMTLLDSSKSLSKTKIVEIKKLNDKQVALKLMNINKKFAQFIVSEWIKKPKVVIIKQVALKLLPRK